jgi:hypothetical protein
MFFINGFNLDTCIRSNQDELLIVSTRMTTQYRALASREMYLQAGLGIRPLR